MFQVARNAFSTGLLVAVASLLVRRPEYKTVTVRRDEVVDFVVVGSGSAGSVVASRLSEQPGWSVLVLEAGGQPPPMSKIPAFNWYGHVTGDTYLYNYAIEPQKYAMKSFTEKILHLAKGKMIGGSSAINAMIYIRGNRMDFDRWGAMGNSGWDYDSVLPFFRKLEDYKGKHAEKFSKYHGTGGPVSIESFRWEHPFTKYYIAAGKELGLNETDFNSEQPIGYTPTDMTIKDGQRHSASEAYLQPNLHRPNLRIQIHSQVIKVIIDKNSRAVGVEYFHEGMVKRVFVRKEVILSAGAIDSPKLLMLSGIGPKEHLQSHKIEVIKDLKGVGQNLQDHLLVLGLTWLREKNTDDTVMEMGEENAHSENFWVAYKKNRTGPLTVPLNLIGHMLVNVGDNPDPETPDTELSFTSRVLGADGGFIIAPGVGFKRQVTNGYIKEQFRRTGFQCEVYSTVPKSRGTLSLRSRSPFDPPIVDPNYLSHPDDVDVMVKGIKYCLDVGNTTAIRVDLGAKFYEKPLPGCKHLPYGSDDYWRCYVRGMTGTACHHSATCKMAPDSDPDGVVSARLKVRGIKGLRVVDASIMPVITSNNINAPTLMIGEKGAAMLKEDWGIFDS